MTESKSNGNAGTPEDERAPADEAPTFDPTAPVPDEESLEEEEDSSEDPYDFVEQFYEAQTQKKPIRKFPKLVKSALSIAWAAHPRAFLISTILQLLSASALSVQLLASRTALNQLFAQSGTVEENFRAMFPSLITLGLVGIGQRLAQSVQNYQSKVLSLTTSNEALSRLLDVTTTVELEAFEDSEFFNKMKRAQMNAGFQHTMLINGLLSFVGSTLGLIGIAVGLFVVEPLLIPLLVFAYLPTWFMQTRTVKEFYALHKETTASERERSYLTTVLTGKDEAKEVRAFGLAPALRERYNRLYNVYTELMLKHELKSIKRDSVGALATTVLTGGIVLLVVYLVIRKTISFPEAGSAVIALQMMRGRLSMLTFGASSVYQTSLFVEDATTFMELKEKLESEKPSGSAPPSFERLMVEDLVFSYPGSRQRALDGVSLEINAGEVIALVGENGSGKTTLAKLLARLYKPTEGQILWDGADIAEMDPDEVRKAIAVIFQDFIKYKLPARENIGVGQIEKFDELEAIIEAAKQSGAHEFLAKLKNGYETVLSKEFKGGRDLSVGQWQKMALSRAFFRDAPFIILDEPTAALDPRAEQNLFDGIRSLTAGRSVLLISHRFSSVRSADRTYVLQSGKIIEHGSHKELMAKGGLYAELFTLQASQYLDVPSDASELSGPPV